MSRLMECVKAVRAGKSLKDLPKPEKSAQEQVVVMPAVAVNVVVTMFPLREPMRLPEFDGAARFRCFRPPRRGVKRPRYKQPRRGGIHFRKHARAK